jgi:DNA-binding MarR family transcriptional regulator
MASEKGVETSSQAHSVAATADAVADRFERDVTAEEPTGAPTSPTSKAAPVVRYDLRVFQALRRIMRALDLHSHSLSAKHKITAPQLACLLAVQEGEPVSASVIAREVHLSPSTVVGILDRLEAKNLVRRERSATDRRVVHVWLTEAGRELIARAPSPLQDRLTQAMDELPEEELVAMAESLERIVEIMEIHHIDAAPILITGPIVPPKTASAAGSPLGTENPRRVKAKPS